MRKFLGTIVYTNGNQYTYGFDQKNEFLKWLRKQLGNRQVVSINISERKDYAKDNRTR